MWPWLSGWRALGEAGWSQGADRNRTGSQRCVPGWPEGLQGTMGPWGSFIVSPLSPPTNPKLRVGPLFSQPSQVFWCEQSFSMTSCRKNGPHLLPVWEIRISQPQVCEGSLYPTSVVGKTPLTDLGFLELLCDKARNSPSLFLPVQEIPSFPSFQYGKCLL